MIVYVKESYLVDLITYQGSFICTQSIKRVFQTRLLYKII